MPVKIIFTRAHDDGREQWITVELPTYKRAANLARRINNGLPVQDALGAALHGEHWPQRDDQPYRDLEAHVTS